MPICIRQLDHWVLTVADVAKSVDFYTRVLGMSARPFADDRWALHFGTQKINIHPANGDAILPRAQVPTPGSADLCLLIEGSLETAMQHLAREHITIESGPIERTGATGIIHSIYCRDPDNNLIELAMTDPD